MTTAVRHTLTDDYLTLIAGLSHDDLLAAAPATELLGVAYGDRVLARPAFLDAAALAALTADLDRVRGLLSGLPDRLFDGDSDRKMAAFARAVGMVPVQVEAVLRARRPAPTAMGRADLYADADGFRLLEFNLGSTLGGMDVAELGRRLLAHPVLADFAAARGLALTDPLAELAATILAECELVGAADRPVVAMADWPSSFAGLERRLRLIADRLAAFGLDVLPCHVGQLTDRDGRVWLDGRPVDVVYRYWMIEDLLDGPDAPALVGGVLRAAEEGRVALFTPMDAELYGSKGALALLSDPEYRSAFDAGERALLDRVLPWTRAVRGDRAALAGLPRADLVLKPTLRHGGQGVLPGWTVDAATWDAALAEAWDGPYVLQRRVRPVTEDFPAPGALPGRQPWALNWGVFTMAGGYGGGFLRAVADPDTGVVSLAHGARVASLLHDFTEKSEIRVL